MTGRAQGFQVRQVVVVDVLVPMVHVQVRGTAALGAALPHHACRHAMSGRTRRPPVSARVRTVQRAEPASLERRVVLQLTVVNLSVERLRAALAQLVRLNDRFASHISRPFLVLAQRKHASGDPDRLVAHQPARKCRVQLAGTSRPGRRQVRLVSRNLRTGLLAQ